ncbi:MAG: SAM-dependent methyltransferase [Gammaproteobacteria bacterium]|nr:SAM-dependent methyltransferase [Gammaproteobacteria bacterium]MCW5582931.1 SAM-dependent methyltransferase [Gammaproteobacteria bacterium]
MTSIYDLPQPGSHQLQRSKALSTLIRQEIEEQGQPISFATFMERALYHPEFGYYNADTFDLGKNGDFTTAPEISSLFAQCLGKQLQQISHKIGTTNILELGAGTGKLAYDLLSALDKNACLPDHYYIYEISLGLRKKQQAFLQAKCPNYFPRIHWLDTLPRHFVGTIIANEVLDALPITCFRIENDDIKERCISWEKKGFAWQVTTPANKLLIKNVSKLCELYSLLPGYESEINLSQQTFIQSVSTSLAQGVLLLIDYGYGQREYYHPERSHGTLSCFYQHTRHHDPLILPGLQDITAHIDFTHLVETAMDYGFSLTGYTSQAAFLLACGLMDLAAEQEKNLSPTDAFHLHHAVKLLTMPTEMGERIKVMALSKNIELSLLGFELYDRRRDL